MDALGIVIGLGPKGVSLLVEMERRLPGSFIGIEGAAIVGAWDSTFAGTSPTRTRIDYTDTIVPSPDRAWTLRTFASRHPLMTSEMMASDTLPKEVVQDYYRTVAQQSGARVLCGERVIALTPTARGVVVTTSRRILFAKYVVVATGLLDSKVFPDWARSLPATLCQHSIGHGLFTGLRGSRVLVAGGGHATPDIACRLWEAGADVTVIVWKSGMKVNHLPYPIRYLKPSYWKKFKALSVARRLCEVLRIQSEGPWVSPRSYADFVSVLSRSSATMNHVSYCVNTYVTECRYSATGVEVTLNDRSVERFDKIVCATGFQPQLSHLSFLDGMYASTQASAGYPHIASDYSLHGSPRVYFLGQLAALGPRGVVEGILYGTQYAVTTIADSICSAEAARVSNL